ncbi:MAG: Ig-like domain-containing protein, partial [Microbacteriaceae bacterium]
VVIDTINGAVLGPINIGGHVAGLAITPDGKKLYAANLDARNIAVIDTATGLVTKTIALAGKTPLAMAISPTGKTVYASTGVLDEFLQPVRDAAGNYIPATITKISTSTDKVTDTVTAVGTQPTTIVVSPDGKKVYVVSLHFDSQASGIAGSTVHAFASTAKKGTVINGLGAGPMTVAVSADNTKLYVTGANSPLYTVETKKYTVVGTADIGLDALTVTTSKDGSLLLVSGTDGRIGVFDAKTLTRLSSVELDEETYSAFAPFTLSPDGMRAYTFNGDQLQTISLVPPNAFPTAHSPNINAPNSSGVVTGNLTVTDSNGDKLTFTATKPAYGTVVLNSDGSFAYTPGRSPIVGPLCSRAVCV